MKEQSMTNQIKLLGQYMMQLKNKHVIMLSTFCGAFDDPHCKKEDELVPAMVDLYIAKYGGS